MTIFGHLKLITSLLFIAFKPSSQISESNGVTSWLYPHPAIERQDDDDDDSAALINLGELLIPAFAVGLAALIISSIPKSKKDKNKKSRDGLDIEIWFQSEIVPIIEKLEFGHFGTLN